MEEKIEERTDEKLEEYKMLREEVQNCIERDNTLSTFMVTAVATILTYAISSNLQVPFLFLISFCIIIPFSARLAHYKSNVARISAYMIVYLENELSIKYETRAIKYKNPNNSKSKFIISMRNYVGMWLGMISYVVYVVEFINRIGCESWQHIAGIIIPMFLLYITFKIDKRLDSVPKERNEWIKVYEEARQKDNNV